MSKTLIRANGYFIEKNYRNNYALPYFKLITSLIMQYILVI